MDKHKNCPWFRAALRRMADLAKFALLLSDRLQVVEQVLNIKPSRPKRYSIGVLRIITEAPASESCSCRDPNCPICGGESYSESFSYGRTINQKQQS